MEDTAKRNTLLRAVMRPKLASRFSTLAMLYVVAAKFVFPILNQQFEGWDLSTDVDYQLLGILLAQPIAWVFGRSYEKARGVDDVA